MRQSLSDLCVMLGEQRDVLKGMLELAKEKRRIIIANESDKLEDIIRAEFKEMNRLGSAEKKRMALINDIAAEMGIPADDITVSKIAERAGPEERDAIRRLQEELTPLIGEHTAINAENRKLIESHIEYSRTMLELMVGVEDPLNNMYGGDGRAAPDKAKKTSIYDGHA